MRSDVHRGRTRAQISFFIELSPNSRKDEFSATISTSCVCMHVLVFANAHA